MISIEAYDEETMEKAKEIQSSISLPPQLDSIYFISRMIRANDNVDEVKRLINEILLHRSLLGYCDSSEDTIYNDLFPQVFKRFSISKLDKSPRSGNVHVFVQRMKDVHLKDILTTIPGSDILHAYFALQEIFGRTIVATEKEIGEPSAIVTILDLEGLNLSEFINPLSVNCKIAKLIVSVWAEYFSETLVRILIINSPGIISLMWTITKHIVDARTANRLVFLSNIDQLKEYLHPQAIPVEYGGEWIDNSGFSQPPSSCSTKPRVVLHSEILDHNEIWRKNGIEKRPPSKSYSIKSKKHVDVPCSSTGLGSIIYSFTTSGELVFSIHRIDNGKEIPVWPPIRLTSLIVPEQRVLPCSNGEYFFRFSNPSSSWINSKVSISIAFLPS